MRNHRKKCRRICAVRLFIFQVLALKWSNQFNIKQYKVRQHFRSYAKICDEKVWYVIWISIRLNYQMSHSFEPFHADFYSRWASNMIFINRFGSIKS